jgi:hypothetical protein
MQKKLPEAATDIQLMLVLKKQTTFNYRLEL